jgi:hypothetical protein
MGLHLLIGVKIPITPEAKADDWLPGVPKPDTLNMSNGQTVTTVKEAAEVKYLGSFLSI